MIQLTYVGWGLVGAALLCAGLGLAAMWRLHAAPDEPREPAPEEGA